MLFFEKKIVLPLDKCKNLVHLCIVNGRNTVAFESEGVDLKKTTVNPCGPKALNGLTRTQIRGAMERKSSTRPRGTRNRNPQTAAEERRVCIETFEHLPDGSMVATRREFLLVKTGPDSYALRPLPEK